MRVVGLDGDSRNFNRTSSSEGKLSTHLFTCCHCIHYLLHSYGFNSDVIHLGKCSVIRNWTFDFNSVDVI